MKSVVAVVVEDINPHLDQVMVMDLLVHLVLLGLDLVAVVVQETQMLVQVDPVVLVEIMEVLVRTNPVQLVVAAVVLVVLAKLV
jgi:hypothetical protein